MTPTEALLERAVEALRWYGKEAGAACRHMGNAARPEALVAILTVLANDGGARAGRVIADYDAYRAQKEAKDGRD